MKVNYKILITMTLLSQQLQSAERPNVVIVLADDQGWGELSLHGNTNLETPHIDRLASEGVQFRHFFVQPVCSPTRAEFLTGRYHPRMGVYSTSAGGERMDTDETTLADLFKEAGYRTAAFGKWHNGMQYPYHPNARGFDEFYGFCSGHWGNYMDPVLERNGQLVQGSGYLPDDLTNRALTYISDNQDHPFLVYLSMNTPHSPMQVTDEWWERYRGRELRMRGPLPHLEDEDHTRAALAMCANIDWNVGRLMAHLKTLGLKEKTLFIYFSDNGPNGHRWNDGMKGIKGSVAEGGVRVPFIMSWPGAIASGESIADIAGAIDILPTLTEAAGIPARTNYPLDGVSLWPLLSGNNSLDPERVLFASWHTRLSVRDQRFRLHQDGDLYDLLEDPGQIEDVSGRFPEVTARLSEALEHFRNTVLAELPVRDERPFPVGHPDFPVTQLPARDAISHGTIQRSNRFPNSSFFTHWRRTGDFLSWDVEVLQKGRYRVEVYYTCPEADTGSTLELRFGDQRLRGTLVEAFNPPLRGMEHDRVPRMESYVKDFNALDLGIIELSPGRGPLVLQATEVPGSQVMDFRQMVLTRVP